MVIHAFCPLIVIEYLRLFKNDIQLALYDERHQTIYLSVKPEGYGISGVWKWVH